MVTHADITQIFKMAAVKPEIYEIPTATPMFLGPSFTMGPVLILCSVSGCERFNMAAINRK